ncbi:MAG: adaptor protein MecA [Lachnospiraceae bacterium]
MRLERISENQIRCTLSKNDLEDRNLFINELAYSTDKTKALFRDMMQQAFYELGFDAEDIPLMIEAIPSAETLVLVITKVEDPEELDTRFSKFTKPQIMDLDLNDPEDDDEDEEDFATVYDSIEQDFNTDYKTEQNAFSNLSNFSADKTYRPNTNMAYTSQQVFRFYDLDMIITVASLLRNVYHEPSQLYKDSKEDCYYLMLNRGALTSNAFLRICNLVSEYGDMVPFTYASIFYFQEHFVDIAGNYALETLAKLVCLSSQISL